MSTHQLVPHFILDNFARGQRHGRLNATALFVDISGFTAITESLLEHGPSGAETLAAVMQNLFEPMVAAVYAHGGFVANFAGDAFTAVFPEAQTTAAQALTAAHTLQAALARHPERVTPFGTFRFVGKVGMGAGQVEWGILGTADGLQHTYYFKGEAIEGSAYAERYAGAGEIVLTPAAWAAVADLPLAGVRLQAADLWHITAVYAPAPPRQTAAADQSLNYLARAFEPDATRTLAAQGESRTVLSLFINLRGSPNHDELAHFATWLFTLLSQYGGYLDKLAFDDKGCNLLLFWGAPTGYENNIVRGLNFILHMRERSRLELRAGMTYGRMFAGLIGSSLRQAYSCYGTSVNMAARKMTAANWGEVWVDAAVYKGAALHFDIIPHGSWPFNGFAEPQPVYLLRGRRSQPPQKVYQHPLIGREHELHRLLDFVQPIFTGLLAGSAVILGATGIGKSRLAHGLESTLHEQGEFTWALCQTDEILRQPLNPFRYFASAYFHQSPTQSETENKAAFEEQLTALQVAVPLPALQVELGRTRSFLGALIGLHWEDSLYARLDPALRLQNTFVALRTLLQALSLLQPLVIHIEDGQWLDADSQAFLADFGRRLLADPQPYPITLITTARELAGQTKAALQPQGLPQMTLPLAGLPQNEVWQLARNILQANISAELVELLTARAEGNPLFVEQTALFLYERGLLRESRVGLLPRSHALAETALPADVGALLVARIDALTQEVKLVVQTAAVLGREFIVDVLSHMLDEVDDLRDRVEMAEAAAIWSALSQERYLFKHGLLRDAAYEMQLRGRLQALHQRAAEAMTQLYAADLAPHYGQLAYHYGRAQMAAEERRFARLAGEAAAAQFSNQAALDYFGRALALTPTSDTAALFELRLARETVLGLVGNREAQEADLAVLEALAQGNRRRQAQVALRRAHFIEATADYESAIAYSQLAVNYAQEAADVQTEARGRAAWGMVAWRSGRFDVASEQLEAALGLSQQGGLPLVEADVLRNLGNVRLYQGDYAEADSFYTRSLEICRELGDVNRESAALNNLGTSLIDQERTAEARPYFEAALRLRQRIGDRRGESFSLNNLGNAARASGDYSAAKVWYEQSLVIAEEIDDPHSRGNALGNLGIILGRVGDYAAAARYFAKIVMIFREIGDRWSECLLLCYMALNAYQQGDNATAEAEARAALALAQQMADRPNAAYAWLFLGHALYGQGALGEAAEAYAAAAALREALGQRALAIECKAGLLRVQLAQGEGGALRPLVAEVGAYLAGHKIEAVEEPMRVYLSCYQGLLAIGEEAAAAELLAQAHVLLQAKAAKISDEELRRSYLEGVGAHREIVATFAAQM